LSDTTIGQLIYKITGDNSGLKNSLKESESGVSGLTDILKTGLKAVVAFFAVDNIIKFGKESLHAAENAELVAKRFGTVYSTIADEGNEAASSLAKSFGLTITAAKDLLAKSGLMLESFGYTEKAALDESVRINELAVDLASFAGKSEDVAGASEAITRALTGATRGLKAYGIALSPETLQMFADSQGKILGNMTPLEKAQLTMNAIMQAASGITGDYNRNADTLDNINRRIENNTKNLKKAVGDELLPAVTNLASAWEHATENGGLVSASLIKVAQAAAVVIEAIASLVRITSFGMDAAKIKVTELSQATLQASIHTQVNKMAESFGMVGQKSSEVLKAVSAMADMDTAQDKVNSKAQIAISYYKSLTSEAKNLRDKNVDLTESINETTNKIQKSIDGFNHHETSIKKNTAAYKGLTDAQKNHVQEVEAAQAVYKLFMAQSEEDITAIQKAENNKRLAQFKQMRKKYLIDAKQLNQLEIASNKKMDQDIIKDTVNRYNTIFSMATSAVTSLLSALTNLEQAHTNRKLALLDQEYQATLRAAGLEVDTVKDAEAQMAKDVADGASADVLATDQKAINKAKIEKDYEHKKAQITYEGQKAAYDMQLVAAGINLFQAPLTALATGFQAPWFLQPEFAIGLAGLALYTAKVNYDGVKASKPIPPSFEFGGIVPGNSPTGDNIPINANSGEMVLTKKQQANLFNQINSGGGGIQLVQAPAISKQSWFEMIWKASQAGLLFIDKRCLT
jgi:hypothetical protein